MTSKNGCPELVSLLQYMKETHLDNPEILVKDLRIEKIAEIVEEVKQSDEWEAVKMSILSIGIDHGKILGEADGKLNGKRDSIFILLKELGPVPENIKSKILNQTDMNILDAWVVKAARAKSVEDFIKVLEQEI